MVFASRKVEQSLAKKGFKNEPGDHKFFVLYNEGKRTKVSHNNQEINDYLIGNMSRQLHLNKLQFCDLINCPLSENAYKKILKDKNVIK